MRPRNHLLAVVVVLASLLPAVHAKHPHVPGELATPELRAELWRNVSAKTPANNETCTASAKRVLVLTFNDKQGSANYELSTMINALYTHVRSLQWTQQERRASSRLHVVAATSAPLTLEH